MKYSVDPHQHKVKLLLHFHGNTDYFYIVDSYIFVNNNKRRGCVVAFALQQYLQEHTTV